MYQIELDSPLDMHVHFRQGDMLKWVVPQTAATFAGALVMPNTDPIINGKDRLLSYKDEVCSAAEGYTFEPHFTAYFQTSYDKKWLEEMKPHLLAIKFYPKGMTTNSHHGVEQDDPGVERVLADMEELGIPLCVHGEARGFCLRREELFLDTYIHWAEKYPKLKIVMEHITTASAAMLLGQVKNLYATITVHHMLCDLDTLAGDLLDPHMFCKPILKYPEDREALWGLAVKSNSNMHKVMLGTDSAPHTQGKKECACGCAGVFTAPFALQLLANEYATHWQNDPEKGQERFNAFAGGNARRIYGIQPPKKTVLLERRPFTIPSHYEDVVPMWAGRTIPWSVDKIHVGTNVAKADKADKVDEIEKAISL